MSEKFISSNENPHTNYDEAHLVEKETSIEAVVHNPYDTLPQLKQLPAHERIVFLRSMITELGSTHEGTNIPLHNENGAEVELLSYLLSMEEAMMKLNSLKVNNPSSPVYN